MLQSQQHDAMALFCCTRINCDCTSTTVSRKVFFAPSMCTHTAQSRRYEVEVQKTNPQKNAKIFNSDEKKGGERRG